MKYNFKLAKQVWRIKLPPAEREVLRVLCEHANDENITYPSNERIAWHVDMSPRNVQRMKAKLVSLGILTPIKEPSGGRGVSSVYKIDLTKGEQKGECPTAVEFHFTKSSKQESDNHDKMAQYEDGNHDTILSSFPEENNDKLSSLSDANNDNLSQNQENNDNLSQNSSETTPNCHPIEDSSNQKPRQIGSETTTNRVRNHDKSGFAYKEEHTFEHTFEHTESRCEPEKSAKPVSRGKPRSTRSQVCDEDFLKSLQENPIYAELNVNHVYGKMVVWCEIRGKQPTRRRLVNWLNSEDRPLKTNSPNSNGNHNPNNGLTRYEPNQQRPRETHNARAARKTFERIEALRLAAGGFDCPDPDGPETPWTPVD